ncbi:hypothetical protein C8Q80DRAFT_685654 [Daedaleopsis nitida]|nr:hypothetical protein C8Q80DRAFT_685654 [Daedaleopsis nitida]
MSTLYLPIDLRVCDSCGCEKSPLKRCSGCSAVVYCSKECQRKAWSAHKELCRSDATRRADAGSQSDWPEIGLGYETPMAFMCAFRDWGRAHYHNVTIMANCAVYSQGGVELITSGIVEKDAHQFAQEAWDEVRKNPEITGAEDMRTSVEPNFAGYIPTVFLIAGTPMRPSLYYPICRLVCSDGDVNSETKLVFSDVTLMCAIGVHLGYAFYPSEDDDAAEPGVEMYVPTRKGWKARLASEDCWDTDDFNPMVQAHIPGYQSGLSPRALWGRFKDLSTICCKTEDMRLILEGT